MTGGAADAGGAADTKLPEFRSLAEVFEQPQYVLTDVCAEIASLRTVPEAQRGDALENLIAKLFSGYPRLFVDEGKRRGVLERDRVITIRCHPGSVTECWESHELVVDARNRTEKYSSADVAEFAMRLRESGSTLGLAVAISGFSTQRDASAAGAIQMVWFQDRVVIGAIDGDTLHSLCDGNHWLELVHEALTATRHGARYRS